MPQKVTTEILKTRIEDDTNFEYKLLGNFVSAKTKVLVKHVTCGNEYLVTPSDFKSGRRCPICAKQIRADKKRKSHEDFVKEVNDLVGTEYEVKSQYKLWNTKITFKHTTCGNTWVTKPANILAGFECPWCKSTSKGEKFIKRYLDLNSIELDKYFA